MSNIIYNAGLRDLLVGTKALDTATYKVLLERSTSAYTPNKDHATLSGLTGLVEVSVSSYARQSVASVTITADNTGDKVVIDCGDVSFGNLEAGQTVKAAIVYQHQAGGDGNCIPLFYIDTDSGGLLPRALGGGAFTIQIAATGLFSIAQA